MKQQKRREPKPHTAKAIFDLSQGFGFASTALGNSLDSDHRLFEPFGVCAALTLELLLKCLIKLEGKTPENTHDHVALFEQLKPATQEQLRERYQALLPAPRHLEVEAVAAGFINPHSFSFDEALDRARNTFEALRYRYEGLEWQSSVSGYVAEAVRVQILANYAAEVGR